MCWYTYKKELIKPKFAEDNIVCNKIVYLYPNNIIKSLYFDFNYEINVLYELDKEITIIHSLTGLRIINGGFHSYSTDKYSLQRGLKDVPYLDILLSKEDKKSFALASCIIPKGALYFLNERGEYVSNKIKMLSAFRIEK